MKRSLFVLLVLCTIVSVFGCSCTSSKIKMADSTVVECKEVLEQEDLVEGLSKETLQQMIDDVIQKY